jgi:hypothetical protein
MNERSDTEMIRATLPGEPPLLEGEAIAFRAKPAFSFFHWIAVVIVTFVPPFLGGVAIFFFLRYRVNHSAVWVTNKRLIDFEKKPFKKTYRVTSIPLSHITKIRRGRLDLGPSDLFLDLCNRMVGVSDVSIFVDNSLWAKHSLSDIKPAGELIRYVQRVIPPVASKA